MRAAALIPSAPLLGCCQCLSTLMDIQWCRLSEQIRAMSTPFHRLSVSCIRATEGAAHMTHSDSDLIYTDTLMLRVSSGKIALFAG